MKLDPNGKQRDARKRAIRARMRSRSYYEELRTPDGADIKRWDCQVRAKQVAANYKKGERKRTKTKLHLETRGIETDIDTQTHRQHLVPLGTKFGDLRPAGMYSAKGNPLNPNLTFEELIAEAEARRSHFDGIRSRVSA